MPTVSEFHTDLRTKLRQGDAYDADIISETRRAAKYLENLHEWPHMRYHETIEVAAEQTGVVLTADYTRMNLVADLGDAGEILHKFKQIDATNLRTTQEQARSTPLGYLTGKTLIGLNHVDTLEFDPVPTSSGTLGIWGFAYSTWPLETASAEDQVHWILDNLESALMSQAMWRMCAVLRDPKLQKQWAELRETDLREAEAVWDRAWRSNRDNQFRYSPQ